MKNIYILLVLVNSLYSSEIKTCLFQSSPLNEEYVECGINNMVEVLELLHNNWGVRSIQAPYITFEQSDIYDDAMRCEYNGMFPNSVGNCKSKFYNGSKIFLRSEVKLEGWKFLVQLDDHVYYVKLRNKH